MDIRDGKEWLQRELIHPELMMHCIVVNMTVHKATKSPQAFVYPWACCKRKLAIEDSLLVNGFSWSGSLPPRMLLCSLTWYPKLDSLL